MELQVVAMPGVGKHLGAAEIEQLKEIKRLGEADNRNIVLYYIVLQYCMQDKKWKLLQ